MDVANLARHERGAVDAVPESGTGSPSSESAGWTDGNAVRDRSGDCKEARRENASRLVFVLARLFNAQVIRYTKNSRGCCSPRDCDCARSSASTSRAGRAIAEIRPRKHRPGFSSFSKRLPSRRESAAIWMETRWMQRLEFARGRC